MTGKEFAEARKSLGLSQPKMAEELEVTKDTVSRWERGKWPVPKTVAAYVKNMVLNKTE